MQKSECIPSLNQCFTNFNRESSSGENWIAELEEDVKLKCEEDYGKLLHIHVDPSSKGEVYMKFETPEQGERALVGLNGRYFGGRKLTANRVVEMVYTLK